MGPVLVVGPQETACPASLAWPASCTRHCPVSRQRAEHSRQTCHPTPRASSDTKCVLKLKSLGVPKICRGWGQGLVLTRVAHGRVQEVHGWPGQAQPVHAIWGLFEVRHHANSRVEAPGRIQGAGARRSAGLPLRSPSNSAASGGPGLWRQETQVNSDWEPSRFPGLVGGEQPGAGEGTQAAELGRAVSLALQGLGRRTTASLKSQLFWIVIASSQAWNG